MIDTIAATIAPTARLADSLFKGGEVSEQIGDLAKPRRAKLWNNGETGDLAPRVTYWRYDDPRDTGLLKVEFSVNRIALGGDVRDWNAGSYDVACALDLVTAFVRATFDDTLPHVSLWTVQRVDYCWNWRTDQVDDYLHALMWLSFRRSERHQFADGVQWRSHTRTIKFYRRGTDVLRFEVSNFRDGARRAAEWFGCPRTVAEMVKPGRALYCLASAFDGLGLHPYQPLAGGDELLIARLRAAFGVRNVPVAKHVLWCVSTHGPASTTEPLSLVSRSVYYAWRRRLLDAGFVLSDGAAQQHTLAPLVLPVYETLSNQLVYASAPQNLKKIFRSATISSRKNFGPVLTKMLKISASAPRSNYLVNSLRREAAG